MGRLSDKNLLFFSMSSCIIWGATHKICIAKMQLLPANELKILQFFAELQLMVSNYPLCKNENELHRKENGNILLLLNVSFKKMHFLQAFSLCMSLFQVGNWQLFPKADGFSMQISIKKKQSFSVTGSKKNQIFF